jgi:hypothetical protein
VSSFGELADVVVVSELPVEAMEKRLNEVSPEGILFTGVWELEARDKALSKLIESYELLIAPPGNESLAKLEEKVGQFMSATSCIVVRKNKEIDVRSFVSSIETISGAAAQELCALLDWPGEHVALLKVRVKSSASGSAKPIEVCKALEVGPSSGVAMPRLARMGFGGQGFLTPNLEITVEHGVNKLLPVLQATS